MSDSVRAAADLAALLPMDHPLARVGRLHLDAAVRAERTLNMSIDPRDVVTVHSGALQDAAADPRPEDTPIRIGTPLRDAAVDPHPDDFPGVPNAGQVGEAGNPHGPNVVAIEVGSAAYQAAVVEAQA